jgi:predicted nucleic acid-binding protein
VILADTTVWIDHLRGTDTTLKVELHQARVSMHPFIVAELALGSLRDRVQTLAALDALPQVRVAQLVEVRWSIEKHGLYSRGIGLTDAHLIASTLLTPDTWLWTRDKRLRSVAESMGINAQLQ